VKPFSPLLVLAFLTLVPVGPATAQTTTAQPVQADIDKLPVSLDRIRERLEQEPTLSIDFFDTLGVPVFRTETRSDLVLHFDKDYWDMSGDPNTWARPTVNKWHYDFQKMVNPTPGGFGPGTGLDVLPGIMSVINGFKEARNDRERERVRQRIQDELQQIEDNKRRETATSATTPPQF
jgi:hypothetical protein